MQRLVAIGMSAGGYDALTRVVKGLPGSFQTPIVIIQHSAANSPFLLPGLLAGLCSIPVYEALDKTPLAQGCFVAPPGYHLLVENNETLALDVDEPVNFCRPSIDVFFESAADVFGRGMIGVLLSGANSDGALGLKRIKQAGGTTIVQAPSDAEVPTMPLAAIAATSIDFVVPASQIGTVLGTILGPACDLESLSIGGEKC